MMPIKAKRPRDGSRKAKVYDRFHEQGLSAAVVLGLALGLKKNSVFRWAATWRPLPSDDVEMDIDLVRMRLALSKEMLAEYSAGTHAFANRVELTEELIKLELKDIERFQKLIKAHEAKAP